jgi:glycosyltransferase involved in cell wall biosynthesis
MASAFRRSGITVSLTTHDGTPNTLLEAMACGCFPIAGDLESIREWITPEINGSLVNPADPMALAEGLITMLSRRDLRDRAAEHNRRLILERAEYRTVMKQVERFYRLFV